MPDSSTPTHALRIKKGRMVSLIDPSTAKQPGGKILPQTTTLPAGEWAVNLENHAEIDLYRIEGGPYGIPKEVVDKGCDLPITDEFKIWLERKPSAAA